MERLTERDEFGNADIIGVDSADLQLNLTYPQFNRVTAALNRLSDYEDMGLTPEEIKEDTPKIQKIEQELASYREAEERGELMRVVRCKDCKMFDVDTAFCRIQGNYVMSDDCFCSEANKREESEAALKEEKQ